MKLRLLITLLSLVLIAPPGVSKAKNRDWQTGKLVSIEQGTPEAGPGIVTQTNPPLVLRAESKTWVYIVETDTMTYGFSSSSERPQPLKISAPVKFSLEPKGRAFLLDENGKEFKASVIKVAEKQPAH